MPLSSQVKVPAQVKGAVGGGGSASLATLTDLTLTSPASGDVVKYNGSGWVNGAVSATYSAKCFHGYKSSDTSVTSSTWTSINIEAEYVDTQGGHSTSSNTSRYTLDTVGKWEISGDLSWAGTGANTTGFLAIARNGTRERWAPAGYAASANQYYGASFSAIVTTSTTTDYVEIQIYANGDATVFALGTGSIAISNLKAKYLGT